MEGSVELNRILGDLFLQQAHRLQIDEAATGVIMDGYRAIGCLKIKVSPPILHC